MPIKPRIFLSHSSKDNALTKELRDQLLQPDPDGGPEFEILVDLDHLEAGQPWPDQLHEMMGDCNAAVILLTPEAVKSAWVLKEATILIWRSSLEPRFRVFIAQFPAVTSEQITDGKFGPLQHRVIQGIKAYTALDIATAVRSQLNKDEWQKLPESLFDLLVLDLTELLDKAIDKRIETVADRLGVPAPPWRSDGSKRDRWIQQIASSILRGQLGDYGQIDELVRTLNAVDYTPAGRETFLRLVSPYWVQSAAAHQLAALCQGSDLPAGAPAPALNARHAGYYTAQMYVHRAYPLNAEYEVMNPRPPDGGDLVTYYTKKICDLCEEWDQQRGENQYLGRSQAEIIALLKSDAPWLFIVLPPIKALRDLRTTFPRVRFVVKFAAEVDPRQLVGNVVLLDPLLDTQEEDKQYSIYRNARKIFIKR
jgi:hypothetical protein